MTALSLRQGGWKRKREEEAASLMSLELVA